MILIYNYFAKGAGESGKSTLVKQMKILHLNGYSEEERQHFKLIAVNNTNNALKTILNAMKKLKIEYYDIDRKIDANKYLGVCENHLNEDLGHLMKRLWNDKGVQECFSRSREYQLNDSAK